MMPQMMHHGDTPTNQNYGSFDSADYYNRQSSFGDDSNHGTKGNQDGSKQKHVSRPLASMAKTPFFSQAPPSALSLSQSKWLEDEPVPHVQLPYVNAIGSQGAASDKASVDRASALSSAVTSMSCVSSKISFEKCGRVQHLCLANITDLRQQMGASSDQEAGTVGIYDVESSLLPPPLLVTSAKIVKGEAHLLLERTKALGYSAKFATHSMSTFFNPYAKKQQAGKEKNKVQTTLIAEGEERTIMIEFKNRLAVPLEVPSCQLSFEGKGSDRIEAPPLSFTVPAKTSSFAVHFPFIAAVSKTSDSPKKPKQEPSGEEKEEEEATPKSETEETETKEEVATPDPDIFDVVGLRVTCLNRTFPIRFRKPEEEEDEEADNRDKDDAQQQQQLPPPASVY